MDFDFAMGYTPCYMSPMANAVPTTVLALSLAFAVVVRAEGRVSPPPESYVPRQQRQTVWHLSRERPVDWQAHFRTWGLPVVRNVMPTYAPYLSSNLRGATQPNDMLASWYAGLADEEQYVREVMVTECNATWRCKEWFEQQQYWLRTHLDFVNAKAVAWGRSDLVVTSHWY